MQAQRPSVEEGLFHYVLRLFSLKWWEGKNRTDRCKVFNPPSIRTKPAYLISRLSAPPAKWLPDFQTGLNPRPGSRFQWVALLFVGRVEQAPLFQLIEGARAGFG